MPWRARGLLSIALFRRRVRRAARAAVCSGRRLEHQRRDELGGLGRFGIERERAAGARIAIARLVLGSTRAPRAPTSSCSCGERAAAFDVAIAVEVGLDAIGELARGRSLGRVLGERVDAHAVELGRNRRARRRVAPALPAASSACSRAPLRRADAAARRRGSRTGSRRARRRRPRLDVVAAHLLGRHVARRAERSRRRSVPSSSASTSPASRRALACRSSDARDAPVEHVDLAEVAEHDVRRLEIAMDDAARVRELDREADVDERAQAAAAAGRRLRRARLRERDAGEPLHREVRPAVRVGAELVHRDDRRVLEPRLDPRLAQEPRRPRPRDGSRARMRLIATSRPMRWSCATRTSPMPPRPISSPSW